MFNVCVCALCTRAIKYSRLRTKPECMHTAAGWYAKFSRIRSISYIARFAHTTHTHTHMIRALTIICNSCIRQIFMINAHHFYCSYIYICMTARLRWEWVIIAILFGVNAKIDSPDISVGSCGLSCQNCARIICLPLRHLPSLSWLFSSFFFFVFFSFCLSTSLSSVSWIDNLWSRIFSTAVLCIQNGWAGRFDISHVQRNAHFLFAPFCLSLSLSLFAILKAIRCM